MGTESVVHLGEPCILFESRGVPVISHEERIHLLRAPRSEHLDEKPYSRRCKGTVRPNDLRRSTRMAIPTFLRGNISTSNKTHTFETRPTRHRNNDLPGYGIGRTSMHVHPDI